MMFKMVYCGLANLVVLYDALGIAENSEEVRRFGCSNPFSDDKIGGFDSII